MCMLSKNECRNYINEKKPYLNLSRICKEVDVKQPHLSMFLKTDYYDHYMNIEKANAIVDFIEKI